MLGCGLLAGTEFAIVVEISTISNVCEVEGGAGLLHLGEEFVFAMEAAASVVAPVVGAFEFAGVEDLCRDVVFGSEREGSGQFGAGERGGVGDDGEHFFAEDLMGCVGEVRGVCAS